MSYPGEVRYVDSGDDYWITYVRGESDVWYPVDLGGPGYITDNQISKKDWISA